MVKDTSGIGHTLDGIYGYFYFAQLYTVAFVFHLEVLAGNKYQIPFLIGFYQITRPVDNVVEQLIEWVLNKYFISLSSIAIVS